ncbi:MAG: hypothetical protein ACRCUY_12175 [Thermoguttaceae bacterium]
MNNVVSPIFALRAGAFGESSAFWRVVHILASRRRKSAVCLASRRR